MAQLAIKGHLTKGKEVIEILEMLGGKNIHNYNGTFNECYVIDNDKICTIYTSVAQIDGFVIFTLEEFLEKFPYKVGDKVLYHGSKAYIKSMEWGSREIIYTVEWEKELWETTVFYLQPYKEDTMGKAVFDANAQCCDIMNHLIKKETMEGKIESFEVLESHCANEVKIEFDPSKFEIVKRDNGYYVVKKQPQYPKTYEECCTIMGFNSNTLMWNNFFNINKDTHPYIKHFDNLIDNFCKLLICRDAYWKIAGEQMGLGKPWVPDWDNYDDTKYCIYTTENIISLDLFGVDNKILAFPTEKMRNAFYKYFKELIEACKELL